MNQKSGWLFTLLLVSLAVMDVVVVRMQKGTDAHGRHITRP